MKLLINFDFFEAVRDVNEPLTPMKIIRNNVKYKIFGPTAIGVGAIGGMSPETIAKNVALWYGIYMATDLVFDFTYRKKNDNIDPYATKAIPKLKKLSVTLDEINVKTNYDMLLESELYEKKYKIEKNDRLFTINEKKYIYVPSYGYDGKEKETSILQDHDIGSGIYTLSVGEPEKQYRRVLVNNQA